MDMSDKIVAEPGDELERDREQLKAETLRHRAATLGDLVGHSVGRKLKLMFGAAAAGAGLGGAVGRVGVTGRAGGRRDGVVVSM